MCDFAKECNWKICDDLIYDIFTSSLDLFSKSICHDAIHIYVECFSGRNNTTSMECNNTVTVTFYLKSISLMRLSNPLILVMLLFERSRSIRLVQPDKPWMDVSLL